MKKTYTIILLFLLTFTLNAQNETDSSNIYLRALTGHIEYEIDFNQEGPDQVKTPDFYYVEEDGITTSNLPSEIHGQKIEVLTRKEIIKKVKKNNFIKILRVTPVQWRNDRMEIHVVEFTVRWEKRKLYYGNTMSGSAFIIKCCLNGQSVEIKRIDD